MTVYRFTAGKISRIVLSRRQTYATRLLPGFKLPLARESLSAKTASSSANRQPKKTPEPFRDVAQLHLAR
jgi:hypothetical protein